ncbi:MAG: GFA family protein [Gammaproteobacteria bacterium]|nr:GFA family protein [Gammaproteobacteria bacterium]
MKRNTINSIEGSCLCGAVLFKAVNQFSQFHFCHCKQCQKTSGSAHAANLFIDADQFSWITGENLIVRFDVPGRAISSVFCRQCGCPCPYLSKTGKAMVVPAGALDQLPDLYPQDNIFWSERAAWYDQGLRSHKVALFPRTG